MRCACVRCLYDFGGIISPAAKDARPEIAEAIRKSFSEKGALSSLQAYFGFQQACANLWPVESFDSQRVGARLQRSAQAPGDQPAGAAGCDALLRRRRCSALRRLAGPSGRRRN